MFFLLIIQRQHETYYTSVFGVRVFNPFAPVYINQKLSTAFSANEREKKRVYAERVLEHMEHRHLLH